MKKFFLTMIFFLTIPLIVFADEEVKEEFVIVCDAEKINLNEQLVCRISVNDNQISFNQVNYNINVSDGLSIVDVRSNYDKIWKVTKDGAISKEEVTGLQEFGILLLKGISSGEKEINISNIVIKNESTSAEKTIKDVNAKVKVISDDNYLNDIIINDESLKKFDSKKTSFTYHIDKDATKIKINVVPSNEYSKINGAKEYTLSLNNGSFLIPIEVISENGNTKIYTINVVRDNFVSNNIDKKLKDLKITNNKGNVILINFKPDVYHYDIEVGSDITYFNIEPTLPEGINFVKDYGKRKVNINSGDNLVLIKTVDDAGEELTYTISITKPLLNKSSNNYIKSLAIDGYDLKFSKRVRNYTLEVKKNTKSLEIKPVLDDEKATYQITGNSNLKDGSVVKIIVTAENQVKTTYQINIKYKNVNYFKYICIILIGAFAIYEILKNVKKFISEIGTHKAKKKKQAVTIRKTRKANSKITSKSISKKPVKKRLETKKASIKPLNAKKKTTSKKNVKAKKKSKTNGKNKKRKK